MSESLQFRIRLKLPNGAEMEASGSPEFIRAERETFLTSQLPAHRGNGLTPASGAKIHDWGSIIESRGMNIQLRAKLKGDRSRKDACLVLLAGAQNLLNQQKPTAAQLAKWLRASGYPVGRVDRAISEALEKGELLASGSRRARRYELTGPGKVRALLLAEQLTSLVSGN